MKKQNKRPANPLVTTTAVYPLPLQQPPLRNHLRILGGTRSSSLSLFNNLHFHFLIWQTSFESES